MKRITDRARRLKSSAVKGESSHAGVEGVLEVLCTRPQIGPSYGRRFWGHADVSEATGVHGQRCSGAAVQRCSGAAVQRCSGAAVSYGFRDRKAIVTFFLICAWQRFREPTRVTAPDQTVMCSRSQSGASAEGAPLAQPSAATKGPRLDSGEVVVGGGRSWRLTRPGAGLSRCRAGQAGPVRCCR